MLPKKIARYVLIGVPLSVLPFRAAGIYEQYGYPWVMSAMESLGSLPGVILLPCIVLGFLFPLFRLVQVWGNPDFDLLGKFEHLAMGVVSYLVITICDYSINGGTIILSSSWATACYFSGWAVVATLITYLVSRPRASALGMHLGWLGPTTCIIYFSTMVIGCFAFASFFAYGDSATYLPTSLPIAALIAVAIRFALARRNAEKLGWLLSFEYVRLAILAGAVQYFYFVSLSSNFLDAWLFNLYTFEFIGINPISYIALDTNNLVPTGHFWGSEQSLPFELFPLAGIILFYGPIFAMFWVPYVEGPIKQLIVSFGGPADIGESN